MKASRRTLLIVAVSSIALAAVVSVTYYADFVRNNTPALPPGCSRPAGGFLIVASTDGYNDSIAHGAPVKSWPVITVRQGQNVTIVVCNIDHQAHGFQIKHYEDSNIESVLSGQTLKVSFVADQAGSFDIYCDIFCTIHVFMQNGLLMVTP